ncbi:hypothetical protein Pmar_PMAR023451 [Perkinsus marinus ATCC 50983]|uniref:Uncharacterized protein n=1 Tax=Perkinsus marinus (strain ATCC 50983 / TXsc) TaxID=423536 RepID=C5KKL3_PERM5|nr:hypothetical protein Pmar_PMAR023451 [Perkinsus marinus ATCC 50983]EER15125.1 hypothetical protein Pmar_PMAR023451 [Perkinsus marinus ATCC 50983]|eukprot:XP_002783329.1 hypothetical protein Pmar_PMAR023451 [Perkinsus marinus ATCC 50983]
MYLQAEQLLSGLEETPDEQSLSKKKALTQLVEAGASELVRRAKFDGETIRQKESAEKRKVREARRRAREECLMGWSVMHASPTLTLPVPPVPALVLKYDGLHGVRELERLPNYCQKASAHSIVNL